MDAMELLHTRYSALKLGEPAPSAQAVRAMLVHVGSPSRSAPYRLAPSIRSLRMTEAVDLKSATQARVAVTPEVHRSLPEMQESDFKRANAMPDTGHNEKMCA